MDENDEWLIVFVLVGSVPLIIGILNINILFNLKQKRTPLHYIVINVAVADILSIFNAIASIVYSREHSKLEPIKRDNDLNDLVVYSFILISHMFYYVIMLSSMLMTVDRFISIRFVLRYHEYWTLKRLIVIFISFYIITILVQLPAAQNYNRIASFSRSEKLRYIFPQQTFITVGCMLTFLLSKYSLLLCNEKIQRTIRKRLIFGKSSQQLFILQRRKQSVVDTMYLDALMAMGSTCKLLYIVIYSQYRDGVFTMSHMFTCMCTFIYPIVITFVFKDLRTKYRKFYKKMISTNMQRRQCRIHALVVRDENNRDFQQSLDRTAVTDLAAGPMNS